MRNDNRARRVENASVSLEDGMHFVGDIDGVRVDTDADEGFGGAGGRPQPLCVSCCSGWPRARRWT